jgi:very-short-patch-repair endonuclease
MRKHLNPGTRERARAMRAEMPKAEGLLWWKLRQSNRNGYHFRRQVPLRGYFADFAEHSAKLIIELDGDQHSQADHREHDRIRDQALSEEGYLVLRFANLEVLRDLDQVVESILRAVAQRRPPPQNSRGLEPPQF